MPTMNPRRRLAAVAGGARFGDGRHRIIRQRSSLPSPLCFAPSALLFLVFSLFSPTPDDSSFAAAASASSSHSPSSTHGRLEAERYAPLPPTVFSPSGRLHNVESAAQKSSDPDDWTGSTVVALRCRSRRRRRQGRIGEEEDGDDDDDEEGVSGGGDVCGEEDEWEEFVAVVSPGPRSPHGYYGDGTEPLDDSDGDDEAEKDDQDENGDDEDDFEESSFRAPLLLQDPLPSSSLPRSPPLSILSPTLLIAAAGSPSDSAVFLRRIQDAALSIHLSEDAGVASHPFASHGVRSMTGLTGVRSGDLARRVADAVQIPTQSMGGNAGRIASSSALVVGAEGGYGNGRRGGRCRVWRIDPTGQFWDCDAAAIGRGAGTAEGGLMRRAAKWKKEQEGAEEGKDGATEKEESKAEGLGKAEEMELEDIMKSLSNEDVRGYLGSLSVDEALDVAFQVLVDARRDREDELKKKKLTSNSKGDEKDDGDAGDATEVMTGARYYGIQGLVLSATTGMGRATQRPGTVAPDGDGGSVLQKRGSMRSLSPPRVQVLSWDELRSRVTPR